MFKKNKYKKLLKKTSLIPVTYAESGKMLFNIGTDVFYKERKGAGAFNIKTLDLLPREEIPETVMMIVFK